MRVAVTGTDERLAERLVAGGFEVVECPLVRIEELDGPKIEAAAYDWVLVTSRNAVGPLLARARGPLPRVGAIGPGTADGLRKRGIEPDFVARDSTQEGLVDAMPPEVGRVLHAGAEGARDVLVRELDADFVPLYRTVEIKPDSFPDVDLVVLASASAARSLAAIRADLACVSIGPVTSEEASRHGLEVVAEARTHDLDGLVAAVKLAASHASSSHF
jgi:uroporphyrinogen III methyltransferase / synthase